MLTAPTCWPTCWLVAQTAPTSCQLVGQLVGGAVCSGLKKTDLISSDFLLSKAVGIQRATGSALNHYVRLVTKYKVNTGRLGVLFEICQVKSRLEVRFSIAIPSLLESPKSHHCWQWPLKSPTKRDTYGFLFFIWIWRLSNSNKKQANSGVSALLIRFLWESIFAVKSVCGHSSKIIFEFLAGKIMLSAVRSMCADNRSWIDVRFYIAIIYYSL